MFVDIASTRGLNEEDVAIHAVAQTSNNTVYRSTRGDRSNLSVSMLASTRSLLLCQSQISGGISPHRERLGYLTGNTKRGLSSIRFDIGSFASGRGGRWEIGVGCGCGDMSKALQIIATRHLLAPFLVACPSLTIWVRLCHLGQGTHAPKSRIKQFVHVTGASIAFSVAIWASAVFLFHPVHLLASLRHGHSKQRMAQFQRGQPKYIFSLST